jgi:hypothetical protein
MEHKIGIVGLGVMGANLALNDSGAPYHVLLAKLPWQWLPALRRELEPARRRG